MPKTPRRKHGEPLKGLVVCNHPGGARAVLPVVESFIEGESRIVFDLVLTDNAFPLFNLPIRFARKEFFSEEVSPETGDEIDLHPYAFVLAGTSISGNLEKTFIRKAREQGIPAFSILDHWCEYEARFREGSGQLNAIPNVIFVPDQIARQDLLDRGVQDQQIIVSGHPAFDVARTAAARFTKERRDDILRHFKLEDTPGYLLYVSEPVEADHQGKGLRYSEFSILEMVCRTLLRLDEKARLPLVLKLHPRENPSKFEDLLKGYQGLTVSSVKDEIDRFELLLSAKLILGISSLLLLEAAVLGLPVHCIIPGDAGKTFIGVRLGCVNHLGTETDIARTLMGIGAPKLQRQICDQTQAAHTIVRHILKTVGRS